MQLSTTGLPGMQSVCPEEKRVRGIVITYYLTAVCIYVRIMHTNTCAILYISCHILYQNLHATVVPAIQPQHISSLLPLALCGVCGGVKKRNG